MSSLKSRSAARTQVKHGTLFTAARNAIILRDYPAPAYVPLPIILERLNALPGATVPDTKRIIGQAQNLRINRQGPIVRDVDAPPRFQAEIVERDPGEPIAVSFDQVAAWALANDAPFRDWEDLFRVNDRRFRMRLPTFKKLYPVKGVRR